MAELTLRQLRKSYGKVDVIHGVDLDVADGEFTVFVGPSGCGKSTLLRMIAGLEEISGGEIAIGGARVNEKGPAERGIAMVFQNYALYPHKTVAGNMGFALKHAGVPAREVEAKVQAAAEVLNLTPLLDRLPKALSGGQRQRVAIGRAIVRDPRVFLFDEPLSNLDAALRVATRLEIAKLHHDMNDVTMIYVTHDQVEAMTLADRICVLRDGKVEQVGTPAELYESPNSLFVAGFIGSPKMNFLTGAFAAAYDCDTLGARAEHIEIVGEGQGPWSGKILHAEDLGSDHYLFVEIGSDEPVIVRRPGKMDRAVGQIVTLRPRDANIHRFGADGKPLR